jgi:hypothetical protein
MKNHKAAYFVWLLLNFFMYGWVHLIIVNIESHTFFYQQQGNFFLELLTCSIYVYLFCLCWEALQDHITLSKEINTVPIVNNSTVEILNDFSKFILYGTPIFLLFGGVFLMIGRFAFGAIRWLMTGTWEHFSTCDVLGILCSPETKLIGLKNILSWIGNEDFLIFLIPLGTLIFWITGLHPKKRM